MAFAPVSAWSQNPDANANQPGIPMYEGMTPAQLNDSIRTIMAAINQAYIDPTTIAKIDASNIAGVANLVAAWQAALNIPNGIDAFSIFTSGDIKTTLNLQPPTGWLLCDGRTISNQNGTGTARAAADTYNLFTVLWNHCPGLPIFDNSGNLEGRSSTSDGDWAINRAIQIPNMQGQMIRVWDGSGQIDYNRLLGSLQPDQMQGFRVLSGVGANNAAGSIYGVTNTDCPGGATGYSAQNAGAAPDQSIGKIVNDGTNGTPRVGAETRSKNVAVNVMIKL